MTGPRDEYDAFDVRRAARSLGAMVAGQTTDGRWPYEPPAPDVDPGSGVQEPRRPVTPDSSGGGAHPVPDTDG